MVLYILIMSAHDDSLCKSLSSICIKMIEHDKNIRLNQNI